MIPGPARITLLLVGGLLTGGCSAFAVLLRQEPASRQLAAIVGAPADARWTSTTWEAASTPAHRRVLERARPATITGEVVDASCFLQLGKRGEAHIPCGQKCVRNGQPIGVVTESGRLYLVIPEEHHPRRDGEVNIRDRFAELMGKRVQISGMLTEYHDYRALFVRILPSQH